MKKYTDADTGKRIVEVYDLSFLSDKDHPYGWLKRHFLHFRMKFALWKADLYRQNLCPYGSGCKIYA